MQNINKRSQWAIAGLMGGLIGLLVVITAPSPAAISAVPRLSAGDGGPNVRQVLPGDWDTSTDAVSAPDLGIGYGGPNVRQVLPGDWDTSTDAVSAPTSQ